MRCHISYLLLHNKVPQNLVAQNNKHYLGFSGLGIQVWFCNPIWMLNQKEIYFYAHSFDCWQTVPYHIISSQHGNCELPHNIAIWLSLEWVIPKSMRECSWQKPHSFYNLISEMASHCFCCILVTKLVTKPSPHSMGWLPQKPCIEL